MEGNNADSVEDDFKLDESKDMKKHDNSSFII
jgi:hypothetical protein